MTSLVNHSYSILLRNGCDWPAFKFDVISDESAQKAYKFSCIYKFNGN